MAGIFLHPVEGCGCTPRGARELPGLRERLEIREVRRSREVEPAVLLLLTDGRATSPGAAEQLAGMGHRLPHKLRGSSGGSQEAPTTQEEAFHSPRRWTHDRAAAE